MRESPGEAFQVAVVPVKTIHHQAEVSLQLAQFVLASGIWHSARDPAVFINTGADSTLQSGNPPGEPAGIAKQNQGESNNDEGAAGNDRAEGRAGEGKKLIQRLLQNQRAATENLPGGQQPDAVIFMTDQARFR